MVVYERLCAGKSAYGVLALSHFLLAAPFPPALCFFASGLPLAPLEDTSSAFRFKLLLPATGAKKLL
jgi:hypothetical protein